MPRKPLSLEQFLSSQDRNGYIRYRDLSVYVRKGRRYINGAVVTSLEIANITNLKRPNNIAIRSSVRSTGQFREFDSLIKSLAISNKFDGVFIENVLNEFLPGKLLSYGYQQVNPTDMIPYFWWQSHA